MTPPAEVNAEIVVEPSYWNLSGHRGGKGGGWVVRLSVAGSKRRVFLPASEPHVRQWHGRGHAINAAKWYSERTGIPWRMHDESQ